MKPLHASKNWLSKKSEIFDEDLQALVSGQDVAAQEIYKLVGLRVASGSGKVPATATLVLNSHGREHQAAGMGSTG